jgi:hypothetical protein
MRRILATLAILLVLAACNDRLPLSRLEASAAARNWCVHQALPWGDPVEITPPGQPDADQRSWYTVRFAAPAGEPRVVLVDSVSGWVKQVR